MELGNQTSGGEVRRRATRTPGAPKLATLAEEEIRLKRKLEKAEAAAAATAETEKAE